MDLTLLIPLVLFSASIAGVTEVVRRYAGLQKFSWAPRVMPMMPFLMGVVGVYTMPSLVPVGLPGAKVIWGLLAGAFSGQSYALVKRQFTAKAKNGAGPGLEGLRGPSQEIDALTGKPSSASVRVVSKPVVSTPAADTSAGAPDPKRGEE